MALTLAQANLLTTDQMVQGIIETIINEGKEIADRLPFEWAEGVQFTYNRESTLPTVGFYSVNEVITESTGTYAQVSITLKKMLGDSDLDKFYIKAKSNINDMLAEHILRATKAMWEKFLDAMFYGQKDPVNTKSFQGFWNLLPSANTQKMASDATGAALSLTKLDTMIDSIKPGKPDLLIMNRTVRRRLAQAVRTSTSGVGASMFITLDQFGRNVTHYNEIPIFVTDYLLATELMDASGDFSAKTGGTTSSIWAVKFGSAISGGFFGIQATDPIEVEFIDPVPNKDAIRVRVKWYVELGLGRNQSLAAVTNVTDAAVVA